MSFVKTFLNWGATKCNKKSYVVLFFAGGGYPILHGYFKAVVFFLGGFEENKTTSLLRL